ncbi:MAG TPA: hypothetical protein VHX39_00385 [Acetobacteraceae bacterium]|nr:hypothetical protein [Acetobacteraceae bacterium]
MAVDPHTGLNKYLCPELPTPELTCVSSCTASPISHQGLDQATAAFLNISDARSPEQRARRLTVLSESIKARLLQYFGVGSLAHAILCPSGTHAMLTAAMLIAAEQPGEAMTAILPSARETGTGVPTAAVCRVFDGPDTGRPLSNCDWTAVEIPLRSADGSPRSEDAVTDAFAGAAAVVTGKVVVYLTHGTKTGLIAPMSPPPGADVIVDACQGRIAPETVATYLSRGWPVVVTGSKFFGGPAFSGAVLFPLARSPTIAQGILPTALGDAADLGTLLRWTAALPTIEAFERRAPEMAGVLSRRIATVERALTSNPALVPIDGLRPNGSGWADQPSIFTFAVRDPMDRARLLSVAELRPLYERLARLGALFGQPVDLGGFGGLRVAIGAQTLLDGSGDGDLAGVFAILERAASPASGIGTER